MDDRSLRVAQGRMKFKKLQEKRRMSQEVKGASLIDKDHFQNADFGTQVIYLLNSLSISHAKHLKELWDEKDEHIKDLEQQIEDMASSPNLQNIGNQRQDVQLEHESAIESLNSEINHLKSLLNNQIESYSKIENEKSLLQSAHQKEIQSFIHERDTLKADLNSLKDKANKSKEQSDITKPLHQEIERLKQENADLHNKNVNLKSLEPQIEELTLKSSEKEADLNKEIEFLKQVVEELEFNNSNVENLNNSNFVLQQANNDLKNEFDTIQTENNKLKELLIEKDNVIDELKDSFATNSNLTINNELDELKESVNAKSLQIRDLQSKVSELEQSDHSELERNLEIALNDKALAESVVNDLEERLNEVNAHISVVRDALHEKQTEVQKLEEQQRIDNDLLEQYKQQNVDDTDLINKLQDDLEQYKSISSQFEDKLDGLNQFKLEKEQELTLAKTSAIEALKQIKSEVLDLEQACLVNKSILNDHHQFLRFFHHLEHVLVPPIPKSTISYTHKPITIPKIPDSLEIVPHFPEPIQRINRLLEMLQTSPPTSPTIKPSLLESVVMDRHEIESTLEINSELIKDLELERIQQEKQLNALNLELKQLQQVHLDTSSHYNALDSEYNNLLQEIDLIEQMLPEQQFKVNQIVTENNQLAEEYDMHFKIRENVKELIDQLKHEISTLEPIRDEYLDLKAELDVMLHEYIQHILPFNKNVTLATLIPTGQQLLTDLSNDLNDVQNAINQDLPRLNELKLQLAQYQQQHKQITAEINQLNTKELDDKKSNLINLTQQLQLQINKLESEYMSQVEIYKVRRDKQQQMQQINAEEEDVLEIIKDILLLLMEEQEVTGEDAKQQDIKQLLQLLQDKIQINSHLEALESLLQQQLMENGQLKVQLHEQASMEQLQSENKQFQLKMASQVQYKRAYLKELYLRKDLVYQKQFLKRELALMYVDRPIARVNKFKAIVWLIISTSRLQIKRSK